MDAGEHGVMSSIGRPMDRHWRETRAQGDYQRHKRVYEEAAVKLAEIVVAHGLDSREVEEEIDVFKRAKRVKDDAWRILREVMFG